MNFMDMSIRAMIEQAHEDVPPGSAELRQLEIDGNDIPKDPACKLYWYAHRGLEIHQRLLGDTYQAFVPFDSYDLIYREFQVALINWNTAKRRLKSSARLVRFMAFAFMAALVGNVVWFLMLISRGGSN